MKNVIHQSVHVPENVNIGYGNIIEEGVTFHEGCKVGNFNIIKKDCTFGKGTVIGNFNEIGSRNSFGENVVIQGRVRIGDHCTVEDKVTLKIGVILTSKVLLKKNSFMGPTSITLGSTAYRETKHGTIIGENTYIGAGAKLAADIHVADNVIIGANSYVNKDIDNEYTVWAGTPAKFIKSHGKV
jgi:UDP-2-acetamido-3-amino-2,3-dideoxy-glucuronate N-acetyltransferase